MARRLSSTEKRKAQAAKRSGSRTFTDDSGSIVYLTEVSTADLSGGFFSGGGGGYDGGGGFDGGGGGGGCD